MKDDNISKLLEAAGGISATSQIQKALDQSALSVLQTHLDSPSMQLAIMTLDSPVLDIAKSSFPSINPVMAAAEGHMPEIARTLDWQKHSQIHMPAIQGLMDQMSGITRLHDMFRPPVWLNSFNTAIEGIRLQVQPFADLLEKSRDPFSGMNAFFEEIQRSRKQSDRIVSAGWLEHHTTPFEDLEFLEDEEIDAALEQHYTEKWVGVKKAFLKRFEGYDVDFEAKSTLRAALEVHEAGFYKFVPATLFPEIERVARMELHADRMARITSQDKLKAIADELSAGFYGFFAISLYETLNDHLYSHYNNEDQLANIANNPIPNRHATLHGHVSYSKLKNSINTLIMADFIFNAIHAYKKDQRKSAL